MGGGWKEGASRAGAPEGEEANDGQEGEGREAEPVIQAPAPAAQDLWLRGGGDRARALAVPYSSSLMQVHAAG